MGSSASEGKTKVIAILNEKGGVGKTTTVLECVYQMGARGFKNLVIDMDPQANSTKRLTDEIHEPTLFDLLAQDPKRADPELILRVARDAKPDWPNTVVLPADRRLGIIETEFIKRYEREKILKKALAPIKENFDFVWIDLPPTVNTLTTNALVAADAYLVPCDLSSDGLSGARMIRETADELRSCGLCPDLEFIGVLITLYQKDNSLAVRGFLEDLQEEFKEKVLDIRIPHSVKAIEAQQLRSPIGLLDPKNSVAKRYQDLSMTLKGESHDRN